MGFGVSFICNFKPKKVIFGYELHSKIIIIPELKYVLSFIIRNLQSTKDGKMLGSYEIVHDYYMAVNVEKGLAISTKNRFKDKGMTLEVFKR